MSGTDHARWLAVQSRSSSAASSFVYAVTTTNIYCRPNCSSRLARRANVKFYDTAHDATAAGFRPCKRCKPESSYFDENQKRQLAVQKACDYMLEREGEVKLADVADHVGLSMRYFHSMFSATTGMAPGAYATNLRWLRKEHQSPGDQTLDEDSMARSASSVVSGSGSVTPYTSSDEAQMPASFADIYSMTTTYEDLEKQLDFDQYIWDLDQISIENTWNQP